MCGLRSDLFVDSDPQQLEVPPTVGLSDTDWLMASDLITTNVAFTTVTSTYLHFYDLLTINYEIINRQIFDFRVRQRKYIRWNSETDSHEEY